MSKKLFFILSTAIICTQIVCAQTTKPKPKTTQTNKIATQQKMQPKTTVSTNTVKHPEWCLNSTIYEVNLRQYADKSTFASFKNELPRLRKMGVDILWFMPIHPIGKQGRKGTLGSYYAVQNYKEVNPEYGTKDEFKLMVDEAHKMGFKVIIDWVANHTSPDNVWAQSNPEFFTKGKDGKFVAPVEDWSDVIDLNYDNKKLREAMIDAMKYWLTDFQIDGFRCDVAEMVPTDFWIECRKELDKVKPVFMLAEGEKPELHQAFDMTYTWSFYHTMKDVIAGNKTRKDILKYFEDQKKNYNPNDIRMYFTSNHDENTWNKTEFEAFGDAHLAIAAMTSVLPGMPLVYSGQESAQTKHIKFFDKDVIDWNKYTYQDFYTRFLKLHKQSRSVLPGSSFEIIDLKNENMFAFKRTYKTEETIFIMNISKNLETIKIPESLDGSYTNCIDSSIFGLAGNTDLVFEGFQFFVFQRDKPVKK